jgi:hypothetical protein
VIKTKTMHVTVKFDSDTQLSRVIVRSTGREMSGKGLNKDGVEALVVDELRSTLRDLGALKDKEAIHE